MGKVGKKVGRGFKKIVKSVVGFIGDAVEWVVDEIVKPVVNTVGDIIDYALDNPIEALAIVASLFVPGLPLWVIPLASGAQTLVNGGDLGDAVKSAALAYAGQYVGSVAKTYVAPTISTSVSKAISNPQLASTVALALEKGVEAGAKAFVSSEGDLEAAAKAFATAGTLSGVSSGLEYLSDKAGVAAAADGVMGNIKDKLEESGFGKSLNDVSEGVKKAVYAGVAAELTGQNVSSAMLNAAKGDIFDAIGNADFIDNFVGDSGFIQGIVDKFTPVVEFMDKFEQHIQDTGKENLSDAQLKILTDSMTAAWDQAKLGNPDLAGEAFFDKMAEPVYDEIYDTITDPLNDALDQLTGNAEKTEAAATPLNEALSEANTAARGAEDTEKAITDRFAELTRLEGVYNAAVSAQDATAANAAAEAYNAYNTQLTADLPGLEATYNQYVDRYNEILPQIDSLQDDYEAAARYLVSDIEDLDEALVPVFSGAERVAALTLRPGIDQDKYRELNGLSAEDSVFGHYLANQGTAQVFDPDDLNAANPDANYTYDAATNRYFVDTPDGRQEVDPYAESMAGAESYDAPTMQALRASVAPVEFLGRITADMSNILGDEAPQGGVLLPTHFKALKDAGYNIVPYRDPTLGKLVDGTADYDDMVKDFEAYKKRIGDEDLAMSLTVYDPEYGVMSQPVEYTGKTFTLNGTTPISTELQGIIQEAGGYSDAYMQDVYPVGAMLDYKEQGMLPPGTIEALYEAGYTPPEYEVIDAVSQGIVNKVYTKDNPYDFDNIGDLVGDTVGLGVRAIGQLAETFNYANAATNWLGMTDLDIPNTWLGKAATFLEKTGMDMHSPQYREALADYNQGYTDSRADTVAEYRQQYVDLFDRPDMSEEDRAIFNNSADAYAEERANSFVGGAKTIFGGIGNAPAMFFNEVIASEVMQELPVLGAGLLVKGGTKAAAAAAGREIAESTATRLGLGTAIALDFAEAFGGGAQQGYDTAYDSYVRMNMRDSMDPPQRQQVEADARAYAEEAAMVGGTTNMLITGITMGLISANDFEKLALSGKVDRPAFEKFTADVRAVAAESGQEAAEEAGTAAAVGLWVGKDDPSVLASLPADISQGAILGGLAGGGTAGSLVLGQNIVQSTGNPITDTLVRTNPTVQNLIYPEYAPPGAPTTSHNNPDELRSALQEAGLVDNATLNTLLNTTYDAQFVTTDEAKQTFIEANPFFLPTTEQVNEFVGSRDEADLAADVFDYIDPRYVDIAEVKAAAAAEGVTLTDEQAEQYVGEQEETAAIAEIIETYDPQGVNEQEAREAFQAQGFDPTDEQVQQFMREGAEGDILAELSQFVDVNQVTEEEARQYFADIGYNATDAEVAQFVRQQAETDVQGELTDYVDPRMVDADEVRATYEALGLTIPTAADIDALVGQYDEADLAGRAEESLPTARFNALQQQLVEFREALENDGVPSGDIDAAVATIREDTMAEFEALGYTIDEEMGVLRDNIADSEQRLMDQIAANEEAGMSRDEAIQTAVDELATEFGVAQESIFDRIGETEQSLNDRISGVETAVEDLGTQIGDVETALLDQIAANEEAGMSRDDALGTALGELATELGVTEESLLSQIGQTEASLLDQLSNIQTGLEGQIGDVETRVLDRVQELEDAGIQRDDALGTALGELATELGVTEESLLSQIGQTEASLLDQLSNIQTGLEGQIGDVETRVLDRVQELEDAGIQRDDALQSALSELSTQLGVTEATLLTQMGETAQSLQDQLGGVQEQLAGFEGTTQDDLNFIAELIGKPTRDVTQVDIDFVADLIAQQEVITELSMSQRQYDVTGDGQITQDDFALLEQALAGTDVMFDPNSAFGPATGIYAQQQANLDAQLAAEQQTQQQIDQQTQTQTQLATQLQTQLETESEARRRQQFGDYLMQQDDLYGQRVDVRTPDPMRINYIYDFQSVFATPQQASLFPSPYAEGGQVEDTTDKLLRIIGETK